MLFTSPSFFVFITIFLLLYAITSGKSRLFLLFLASVIFYGWWDWRFLALIGLTVTVDYFVALQLFKTQDPSARKFWLLSSLFINLGILFFFKYCNFFLDTVAGLARAVAIPIDLPAMNVILPLGISFYTFQSLSYTIDVYQRVIEPERSWIRYASFVMLFPKLITGPIVRPGHLLPQLRVDHPLKWSTFQSGMELVFWGFFMKCVVADSQSKFVDSVFVLPEVASSVTLMLAVLFYAFQVYGDFAGYSFIAIGLGEILGFDFGRNFDRPYFSLDFSEFWQRWHISLSTWLRNYLYIPLGGNRYGTFNTYRNLMLTMLIGGLWHGASWNFIIWGGLHGLYLVIQRLVSPACHSLVTTLRIPGFVLKPVQIAVVFVLVCVTWIFFRAPTLESAMSILRRIILFDGQGFNSVANRFEAARGILLISFLVVCEAISFRIAIRPALAQQPLLRIALGAALIWIIALFGTFGGNSFIYSQF